VTARDKDKHHDAATVKKLHDQILNQSLGGSVFVQWTHLDDEISDLAPRRKGGGRAESASDEGATGWEGTPGSLDGIYAAILLPAFRADRDPRALEYWDAKLRRETDQTNQKKVTFDIDKFNLERRPALLWSRAEEELRIGLKNRAEADMFSYIKAYPNHPNITSWIAELEGMLAPPVPSAAPPTAAAVPGADAP
jgi:hypothetical protein